MQEITAQYPITGALLIVGMAIAAILLIVFAVAGIVLFITKDRPVTTPPAVRGFVHNKSGHFIQL